MENPGHQTGVFRLTGGCARVSEARDGGPPQADTAPVRIKRA